MSDSADETVVEPNAALPPELEADTERGDADKDDAVSRCSCGHDRGHHMVSARCKYTGWGWFWVTFMGVSTRPIEVTYICRKCKEVIEVTDDPRILNAHI